jgi:hypothetical protein
MLQTMQQPADPAPSPISPNFAGLLAALAAPDHKPAPAWDDELRDDVATLSYERALRTHARYRSAGPTDRSLTQSAYPAAVGSDPGSLPDADPSGQTPIQQAASPLRADPGFGTAQDRSALSERNVKRASITIRLSQAECAQLHERAAEAGLTVSAYLRSCTLEVESLRAQVKEALAQLRSGVPTATHTSPTPDQSPRLGWLLRTFTQRRSRRQTART